MLEPNLTEGQVYIAGRGEKQARELMALAKKKGFDASEVSATSHGYIVPEGLLDDDSNAVRREDQPAVQTEPGTTRDPKKAWNAEAWKAEQENIKKHGVEAADKLLVDRVDASEAEAEEPADEEKSDESDDGFNPLDHTVAEVVEYLEGADEKERARVLKVESESESPRKGISKLAEDKEGDK